MLPFTRSMLQYQKDRRIRDKSYSGRFNESEFLNDIFNPEKRVGHRDNARTTRRSNLQKVLNTGYSGRRIKFNELVRNKLIDQNALAVIKNSKTLDSMMDWDKVKGDVYKIRGKYREMNDKKDNLQIQIEHYLQKWRRAIKVGSKTDNTALISEKEEYAKKGKYKKKIMDLVNEYDKLIDEMATFNSNNKIKLDTRSKFAKETDQIKNRLTDENINYSLIGQTRGTPEETVVGPNNGLIGNEGVTQGLSNDQLLVVHGLLRNQGFTDNQIGMIADQLIAKKN